MTSDCGKRLMDADILKTVGQVAGFGGLSLGVFLLLFRDVIRKQIFPQLTKNDAFRLLRMISILIFLVAVIGIAAWVWTESRQTAKAAIPEPLMSELSEILHQRASDAFKPISYAINHPDSCQVDRGIISDFKNEWGSKLISLNSAVISHRFSQASEIAAKMKEMGGSELAICMSIDCCETPSSAFFKPLPGEIHRKLVKSNPDIQVFLEIFS